MTLRLLRFILFLSLLFSYGCLSTADNNENDLTPKDTIEFYFEVDKKVYEQTDYGEAPQVAIWLEHPDSTFYKTVFVTRRTARDDWVGKVECPVSLPYWKHRSKDEQQPGTWEKLVDAVSGATKLNGRNLKTIEVPEGKSWSYFIEVNASGDYNKYYKYYSDQGLPDTEGNGQPSIVYGGEIVNDSLIISEPVLIGRSEQHSAVTALSKELNSITSARRLISVMRIKKLLDNKLKKKR